MKLKNIFITIGAIVLAAAIAVGGVFVAKDIKETRAKNNDTGIVKPVEPDESARPAWCGIYFAGMPSNMEPLEYEGVTINGSILIANEKEIRTTAVNFENNKLTFFEHSEKLSSELYSLLFEVTNVKEVEGGFDFEIGGRDVAEFAFRDGTFSVQAVGMGGSAPMQKLDNPKIEVLQLN